jgi:PadR family transcriptional regulator PadR
MVEEPKADPIDSLVLELRRGAVVLAVLAQLGHEEYGYSLKRSLAEAGFAVEEGTLYPLLRRLEAQGFLTSRWSLEENRPRRYYQRSAAGESVMQALAAEWRAISGVMERMLS